MSPLAVAEDDVSFSGWLVDAVFDETTGSGRGGNIDSAGDVSTVRCLASWVPCLSV